MLARASRGGRHAPPYSSSYLETPSFSHAGLRTLQSGGTRAPRGTCEPGIGDFPAVEKDQAFAWLERAYRQRDAGLSELKIDPLLASLHSDAHFAALLQKSHLP